MAELPPSRPWTARWIWSEVPQMRRPGGDLFDARVTRKAAWCCLRRSFTVAAVPGRALARVTADSRYVLWVNGREAARGPVRSNPRRLHFDEIDLAPFLRPGRNAIAALVRYFGSANPIWMPAPPCAFQRASVTSDSPPSAASKRNEPAPSWKPAGAGIQIGFALPK